MYTTTDRDLAMLFDFIDEVIDDSPSLAATALEEILAMSPNNIRAERLLAKIEADYAAEDPLRLVIEAAEGLAAQGLHLQAREVVTYIEKRYGKRSEAQAWLEGVDILLS